MSRLFSLRHIQGHFSRSATGVRARSTARMNCSLAVLCWIAISTLLGIFFGYSSLELTTSTSIVALLLGLVLAGTPLFLQRGGIRIDPPDRRQIVAFAMSIFFLVFAVREFGQVVFVAKYDVRIIS